MSSRGLRQGRRLTRLASLLLVLARASARAGGLATTGVARGARCAARAPVRLDGAAAAAVPGAPLVDWRRGPHAALGQSAAAALAAGAAQRRRALAVSSLLGAAASRAAETSVHRLASLARGAARWPRALVRAAAGELDGGAPSAGGVGGGAAVEHAASSTAAATIVAAAAPLGAPAAAESSAGAHGAARRVESLQRSSLTTLRRSESAVLNGVLASLRAADETLSKLAERHDRLGAEAQAAYGFDLRGGLLEARVAATAAHRQAAALADAAAAAARARIGAPPAAAAPTAQPAADASAPPRAVRASSLPAWAQLERHAADLKGRHLRDLLADEARCAALCLEHDSISFDYSRNRLTVQTVGLLLQLAEQARLPEQVRRPSGQAEG